MGLFQASAIPLWVRVMLFWAGQTMLLGPFWVRLIQIIQPPVLMQPLLEAKVIRPLEKSRQCQAVLVIRPQLLIRMFREVLTTKHLKVGILPSLVVRETRWKLDWLLNLGVWITSTP